MNYKEITDCSKRMEITREILEALPEWFGIPEATEDYITKSADQICIAACEGEQPAGFLCLEETGKDSSDGKIRRIRSDKSFLPELGIQRV